MVEERFEVGLTAPHRVDTKARVCVRTVFYSVPARLARKTVEVCVDAERISISFQGCQVASHQRGRKGDEVLDLDHYLEVLAIKPGALPASKALHTARQAGLFTKTHDQYWRAACRSLGDRDGTKALITVLLAHRSVGNEAIVEGIRRAMLVGSVDPAVVLEAVRYVLIVSAGKAAWTAL